MTIPKVASAVEIRGVLCFQLVSDRRCPVAPLLAHLQILSPLLQAHSQVKVCLKFYQISVNLNVASNYKFKFSEEIIET